MWTGRHSKGYPRRWRLLVRQVLRGMSLHLRYRATHLRSDGANSAVDERTGIIIMDGIFPDFGFEQHFEVWGYTIEEIRGFLKTAGFKDVEFSEKLDFKTRNKTKNPISIYFKSKG